MPDLPLTIEGCLLGAALGDALGLPLERLTRERGRKLFPHLEKGPNLVFGRGFISDDTEHICLVASALAASGGEAEAFERHLVRGLRAWFLALPPGVGLATLRSCFKLCLGVTPDRSGVFSAGNGPAMRSAILGVCCDGDFEQLRIWNYLSTRITHTDPKAEAASFAVAAAAWLSSQGTLTPENLMRTLCEELPQTAATEEMLGLAECAVSSATRGESATEFADSLGLKHGVSGYMFHTVPVVLQCALRPGAFAERVEEMVRCGGDADSTASILGGILGARGRGVLPDAWIARLGDRPRSTAWIKELASSLAQSREAKTAVAPPRLPFLFALARNLVFLVLILFHAARRLLPPY